ncbi:MAG: VCBS repeat-containing protein [Anaerolineae bacterium]|nr:VCBS repeat-containing protein [Anaerolineae bacterium]
MKKLTTLLLVLSLVVVTFITLTLPLVSAKEANDFAMPVFNLPPGQIGPSAAITQAQKISDIEGNFTGVLANKDSFAPVTVLSDMNGNGVPEIAVGAPYDPQDAEAANTPGAVWVLYMNANGTVISHTKITSDTTVTLANGNAFGLAVASADFNNDGRFELVVGAPGDPGGGTPTARRGAIWVLFLNADGTVNTAQRITNLAWQDDANFGTAIANIGDLDGDTVPDLAVGASGANNFDLWGDGTVDGPIGEVWMLLMNATGTVKSSGNLGWWNFTPGLEGGDRLGSALAGLGDLNGDGLPEMAIGAPRDDSGSVPLDGNRNRGAIYITTLMTPTGVYSTHQKIGSTDGGFAGPLKDKDFFGGSLANIGDMNGDGVVDLAVGAPESEAAGLGAFWILYLNTNGTVKSSQKLPAGPYAGAGNNNWFGSSLGFLDDLNGDGVRELAVGVPKDDDGGPNRGAVWVLSVANINYVYVPIILKVS